MSKKMLILGGNTPVDQLYTRLMYPGIADFPIAIPPAMTPEEAAAFNKREDDKVNQILVSQGIVSPGYFEAVRDRFISIDVSQSFDFILDGAVGEFPFDIQPIRDLDKGKPEWQKRRDQSANAKDALIAKLKKKNS